MKVPASSPEKPSSVKERDLISILSIEGGGLLQGIVAVVILEFLESELKKLDGKDARLADYFDAIAGTGGGGLITAMLTAPKKDGDRPITAEEILRFYNDDVPNIFRRNRSSIFDLLPKQRKSKFDEQPLYNLIRDKLGETKLSRTLTKVVIPTFDIYKFQTTLFSSFQIEANQTLDAKLSDICIGATATPPYFPVYHFENKVDSNRREFNLIGGGLAVNNPTSVAVNEVITKEMKVNSRDLKEIKPFDYRRVTVISIHTGLKKSKKERLLWRWLHKSGSIPLVDCYSNARGDMVDHNISVLFQAHHCPDNYLRIHDEELEVDPSLVNVAKKENANKLRDIGKKLLQSPVTRLNLDTGLYESVKVGYTNTEALKKFAEQLSDKRKRQQSRAQHTID